MRKNFLFACAIVPCALILFCTCTKDVGYPALQPSSTPPGQVDTCKTDIKFAKHIEPILKTYCALPTGGCHVNNASWGDFTTYGAFSTRSSLAIQRIKNNEMPPDYTNGPKTLTACDLDKLEAWVKDGSQNN
jgi:hypothetical protein